MSSGDGEEVSIHRRQFLCGCSPTAGSSNARGSQYAFSIAWMVNRSRRLLTVKAIACESSLQSGRLSVVPCHSSCARRNNWLSVRGAVSLETSRRERKAISVLAKRWISACRFSRFQSNQLISLSWQYALLFPRWLRRISSPISSIGVPNAIIVKARKFLICRHLSASMAGSSAGPSAPQFQLRFSFIPSRFCSAFSSLCF